MNQDRKSFLRATSIMATKKKQSKEISEQIKAFLAAGGKIEKVNITACRFYKDREAEQTKNKKGKRGEVLAQIDRQSFRTRANRLKDWSRKMNEGSKSTKDS